MAQSVPFILTTFANRGQSYRIFAVSDVNPISELVSSKDRSGDGTWGDKEPLID